MLLLEVSQTEAIAGENAVAISQLPVVWQNIATGKSNVALPEPKSYVQMAQLFQYKLEQGDVDLFKDRPDIIHLKPYLAQLFGQLARETLEFYGKDFLIENYPNFTEILRPTGIKKNTF
ncbi:hypothetical protein MiSe_27290 [Microseira wollei NIES-4236]|uniref:Uncharacterized protein n=1 Tax=Microseira wollei NIES-4236 TaxID=2530354 RepID=A0AAV3XD09_9CYAN|nr:hypothetical protein [Microseira wollei]GET37975.1 hypothetical protein MiSe_27290 [Microseira wollei NIES-4236]